MKILISNAVWSRDYCNIFTRYSVATLLSHGNLPNLTERASVTFQIVTTKRDRRWLLRDPAIAELGRYCTLEWEVLEDFGIGRPPTGAGNQKYPFLSCLQNLGITRAVDHDAIVFNYADFVWTDGSLTRAVEALSRDSRMVDAVFGFCLPVDRDGAIPELDKATQHHSAGVIELAPRRGAQIALEHLHREARLRFWTGPDFTSLPSYVMWPVDKHGVLIRAFHQSILALRVRRDDPQYALGITRGSLDGSFTAELAKDPAKAFTFATDSDAVLVFSLYHTTVDSRLPLDVSRETSLRSMLQSDVTPEQYRFADYPIYLRLHDGDGPAWDRAVDESRRIIHDAERETAFDPAMYALKHEAYGTIPRIAKLRLPYRHLTWRADKIYQWALSIGPLRVAIRQAQRAWRVIRNPALIARKTWGYGERLARIGYVLAHAELRHLALQRRWGRLERLIFIGSSARRLAGTIQARWMLKPATEMSKLFVRSRVTVFDLCPSSSPAGASEPTSLRLKTCRLAARPSDFRIFDQPFARDKLQEVMDLFAAGDTDAIEALLVPRASGLILAPNIVITATDAARIAGATAVEAAASSADDGRRTASLKTAEVLLRRALKRVPFWADAVRALGRNLWLQGRLNDALEAFAVGERVRDDMAEIAEWPVDACVLLPQSCAENIDLAGHLDTFVKYKLLSNDRRPYLLLAPGPNPISDTLLEYWSDYLKIVSTPAEIARFTALAPVYAVNWNWVMPQDGEIVFAHQAMPVIARTWQQAGRSPLLRLRAAHMAALSQACALWGMKEQDKFVCVEIRAGGRDGGLAGQDGSCTHRAVTNQCYPLFRALGELGFWVVYMGDTPLLPPRDLARFGIERLIDYAASNLKSASLHIGLCAKCELFISSAPGCHSIAEAFGRPTYAWNGPIEKVIGAVRNALRSAVDTPA